MSIKVMSFNLRYASDAQPNSWAERRPVTTACIASEVPDLIGTQEGLYRQIKDIAADLPEYSWIGLGRKGGSKDEFAAVFYRTARFEPLEFDHFWLSETPEVIGSKHWGHTITRMVTWVRFLDRESGTEFYFWNTHFDHKSQLAREKAAELVLQRVNELDTELPIILVGDFNAVAGQNSAYDILTAPGAFTDTWIAAEERPGQDYATFHNYQTPVPDGGHIDWILTRGAVSALSTHLVNFHEEGQYPSDHFPLMATLSFPAV